MKIGFKYNFNARNRVRVDFNVIHKRKMTECRIGVYQDDKLLYRGFGIAFCVPPDEWSDTEGRKWAFIDAIKSAFPGKSFKYPEIRKTLQKEYVKMEKELEKK